jgi:diamine N-acetyltransferase
MEDEFHPLESSLRAQVSNASVPLHVYLAMDECEAVGVVVFYIGEYNSFKTTWRLYLEDIYIKESHRGKGLLRKLLKPAAVRAQRGLIPEIAFAVLDWNTDAQVAYKALGTETEGRFIEEGGRTWLRMVFREEVVTALAAK